MGFFQMRGKLVIDGPGGAPIGQIVHESFGVGGAAATAAHAGVTNASTIAQVGLGGVAGMFAGSALGGVQKKLSSAVEGLDKVAAMPDSVSKRAASGSDPSTPRAPSSGTSTFRTRLGLRLHASPRPGPAGPRSDSRRPTTTSC